MNTNAHRFPLADRREEFTKDVSPCPECLSDQKQLTNWVRDPIWKCRVCKHQWTKKVNNENKFKGTGL